jgi:hypothetical protein
MIGNVTAYFARASHVQPSTPIESAEQKKNQSVSGTFSQAVSSKTQDQQRQSDQNQSKGKWRKKNGNHETASMAIADYVSDTLRNIVAT